MNIQFNPFHALTSKVAPSSSRSIKPIVYLVGAIALGILLYQCWRSFFPVKDKNWQEEKPKDDSLTKLVTLPVEQSKDNPSTESVTLPVEKPAVNTAVEQSKDNLSTPSVVEVVKTEQSESSVTFDSLVKASNAFAARISFPTQNNLMKNVAKSAEMQAEVVEHAKTTNPLLPGRVFAFITKFMEFKKVHGSAIEQSLYSAMNAEELVDRLIKKRPLEFINADDSYVLRNKESGKSDFELVGTDAELDSLGLFDYQSYDEMRLSAFLSLFVPTHFINDGNRTNAGQIGKAGSFEPKGIIVGMVGARFEKPGVMEYSHMVVTPEQNTAANGYGLSADPSNPKTIELRMWAEFYGSKVGDVYAFPDFNEASQDKTGRYLECFKGYLDVAVYRERLTLSIESFLLEANDRAKAQGKMGYLHVIGLGLGPWSISQGKQQGIMIEVYADLLKKHQLDHISDLNFSWFGSGLNCGGVKDQGLFDSKGHEIKIHFTQRSTSAKLVGQDEGKLLIAQYSWDSNAYPGNEYWIGGLAESSDPAAACSTMIPELQNPEINPHVSSLYLKVQH